ncbi:MAG TPA: hypothetical protein VGJ32_06495 [Solirubrobacteraceae bacterium]|jgi:hypothetical protein
MTTNSIISFRPATSDDDRVLRDLSELDSARPVERPAVLAVVDGDPVAAVSLSDGRIVADPFTRTEDVVRMLRSRLAWQAAARNERRRPVLRFPRLRPAA